MALSGAIPGQVVAIVMVALLARSLTAATDAKQCNAVADILIIMDSSGSIGEDNYDLMKSFLATLTTNFTIGPNNVQFSLVIFSNSVRTIFKFGEHNLIDELTRAILNTTYLSGGTDTAAALRLARQTSFSAAFGARPNVPKVTIVVTDGISNNPNETAAESLLLRASGVKAFAIGVGAGADGTELKAIASDPSQVFTVDNFQVLDAIRDSLVTTTCQATNQTGPRQLETCIRGSCAGRTNGNYPACDPECRKGYFYSCSNELTSRMDCALGWYTRADGTRYTARLVFNPPSNSCEREVPQCPRDPEDYVVPLPPPTYPQTNPNPTTNPNSQQPPPTPVTCVSSSCNGTTNGNYPACDPECKKGYYFSCSNNYIYKMDCPLGWYVSDNGTRFLAKLVFHPPTNTCERESLYCPRNPQDYEVPVPPTQAPPTRPRVVRPCLSTGSDCSGKPDGNYPLCYPECQKGLYYICSNNQRYERPCAVNWYTDSQQRRYTARMVFDPQTDDCQPESPACPRETGDSTTTASTKPPGPVCQAQSDVLFILDSSASITSGSYVTLVNFVANLTQHFALGRDNILVSVIVFSSNAFIQFGFTAYLDNYGLSQAILSVPYLESGTNTAAALRLGRVAAFSSANGARPNVSEVVVVLTDGISENAAETAREAYLLQRAGVKAIAIGIGSGVAQSELNAIASSELLVFNVSSFDVLTDIVREVVITTCQTVPPTLPPQTPAPCVSGSCSGRPDGTYGACASECANGDYYVCTNGSAQKKNCDLLPYTENGQTTYVRAVYDPVLRSCQARSNACRGYK